MKITQLRKDKFLQELKDSIWVEFDSIYCLNVAVDSEEQMKQFIEEFKDEFLGEFDRIVKVMRMG